MKTFNQDEGTEDYALISEFKSISFSILSKSHMLLYAGTIFFVKTHYFLLNDPVLCAIIGSCKVFFRAEIFYHKNESRRLLWQSPGLIFVSH